MTHAETRDRAGDLQIFGLTLSQLSYRGCDFVENQLDYQCCSAFRLDELVLRVPVTCGWGRILTHQVAMQNKRDHDPEDDM